jgi:hypothetical protein
VATTCQIYAELERHATPVPAPGCWSGPDALPGYYQPPLEPEGLLRNLRERFSDQELLTAGVFQRHAGQPDVALNPDLVGPEKHWLSLRRAPGDEPYDVIVSSGCLSGPLPALAVLHDYRVQNLLASTDSDLLIAFTVEDMASLIAAGFPATTATGMSSLRGARLAKFCKTFKLERPFHQVPAESGAGSGFPSGAVGPRPSAVPPGPGAAPVPPTGTAIPGPCWVGTSPPPGAVQSPPAARTPPPPHAPTPTPGWLEDLSAPRLVAWSPASGSLDPPPEHAAVQAHLRALAEHLGISTNDISSWQPTPAALQQFSFVSQCGSPSELHQILLSSLSPAGPASPVGQPAKKSTSLAAVFVKVFAAQGDRELQKRGLQTLDAQLDYLIYKPHLQRAEQSSDPVTRNDLFMLAAMNRIFNEQLIQLNLQLQAAGRKRPASPPLSREECESLEQLYNIISRLSEKIKIMSGP